MSVAATLQEVRTTENRKGVKKARLLQYLACRKEEKWKSLEVNRKVITERENWLLQQGEYGVNQRSWNPVECPISRQTSSEFGKIEPFDRHD